MRPVEVKRRVPVRKALRPGVRLVPVRALNRENDFIVCPPPKLLQRNY